MTFLIKRFFKKTLSSLYNSRPFAFLRNQLKRRIEHLFIHHIIKHEWIKMLSEELVDFVKKIESVDPSIPSIDNRYLTNHLISEAAHHFDIKQLIESFIKKPIAKKSEPAGLKNGSRVIFVTGVFPSLNHAGGLRIFDLIQELNLRGVKVSLFSVKPNVDDQTFEELRKHLTEFKLVSHKEFHSLTFKSWLNENNMQYELGYFVWPSAISLVKSGGKFLKRTAFEYIEVTTRRVWLDILLANSENRLSEISVKSRELLMCYELEKTAALEFNNLICLTEKDTQFVQEVFQTKSVQLIKTGLSRHQIINKLEKAQDSAGKVNPAHVGFIGNYDHYPNLDGIDWYLENIHSLVLEKVPNYKFVIIGRGPLDDFKKKYAKFERSIQWVGAVEDVVEVIQSLEICVSPLISGAGFRGKVNQYTLLKKPVVSTTIGVSGTPYVHEESIFIEDSPVQFANRIVALINNEALRLQIGNEAYKVVQENFMWDKWIDQFMQVV